jgi:hypothetical protein
VRLSAIRRGRHAGIASAGGDQQEARLEVVKATVERFAYDIGLMMAGGEPSFETSATEELAGRLRAALSPFLSSGDLMRPDFGAFGELRIDGDLTTPDPVVGAVLEFEDRSVRESADGRLLGSTRRRIRIVMSISLEDSRVIDCSFTPLR